MTEGTLRRLPAAVGIALMIAAGTPAFAGSAYPEIADTSLLIPSEVAPQNEMMSPTVTE